MNRTMLKKISLYVGGFIVGGGIGYLLADHFVTKAERLMAEYPKVDEESYESLETPEMQKLKENSLWVPENTEAVPGRKRKKGKNQPTDYTKFVNQNGKKSIEEEVKTRIGSGEVQEEKDTLTGINIINLETYANPVPIRDKVVLTYYEEDNTLVDEEEVVIDSPNRLIGNALEKFGMEKDGDPDTVYVRNGKTKTDYEVVRVKNSYQEVVLGEKPEKKTKARRTRKVNKLEENDE